MLIDISIMILIKYVFIIFIQKKLYPANRIQMGKNIQIMQNSTQIMQNSIQIMQIIKKKPKNTKENTRGSKKTIKQRFLVFLITVKDKLSMLNIMNFFGMGISIK